MKLFTILVVILALAGGVFLMGTDFDLKDTGALPNVDISAEGGRLPEIDATAPDVSVNMENAEVDVPDVDVSMEKTNIKIPTVDFNAANDSVIDEAGENETVERE